MDSSPCDAPIGFGEGDRISIYNANKLIARSGRLEAKNALAALKEEGRMLQLIRDDNWIEYAYEQSKTYPDLRARATWAKVVVEVARLGKRETAPQQAANNVQINIMDPDRAKAILTNLFGGVLPAELAGSESEAEPTEPEVE